MPAGAAEATQPLYRKLRAREAGLSREQVHAHQRLRLQGAMIEAVAAHGYASTTVDELVGLAGVSTRTLYERFGGKRECFLATYDVIIAQGVGRIVDAWRQSAGSADWDERLVRAFDQFVDEIVSTPKPAQLALVEALAVGGQALPRLQASQRRFEEMISRSLQLAPEGSTLPPIVLEAVVHGIWHVSRLCLMEGRPEQMRGLGPRLLEWLLRYRSPRIAEIERSAPLPQPEQRRVAPSAVRQIQGGARRRALAATVQIAGRQGYEALSLPRIAQEAALEVEELAEMYESAEQCFMAGLEMLSARVLACALRAVGGPLPREPDEWARALHISVTALLGEIAEDPVLARDLFIEVLATGPAGAEQRVRIMRGFATLLSRRAKPLGELSEPIADAIAGSIWGIIHDRVVRGEPHTLPALADQVSYIILAPLIGAEDALRLIAAERRPDRSAR